MPPFRRRLFQLLHCGHVQRGGKRIFGGLQLSERGEIQQLRPKHWSFRQSHVVRLSPNCRCKRHQCAANVHRRRPMHCWRQNHLHYLRSLPLILYFLSHKCFKASSLGRNMWKYLLRTLEENQTRGFIIMFDQLCLQTN